MSLYIQSKMKKSIVGAVLFISLLYPSIMQAEKPKRVYGLTGFVGTNHGHFLLHPYIGKRWDRFELGLEGIIGKINYKLEDVITSNTTHYISQGIKIEDITISYISQNTIIAGVTLNAYYDLFKIKKNRIFVGVGEGFSYWSRSINQNRTIIEKFRVIDENGWTRSWGEYAPIKEKEKIILNKKLPIVTHGEIGLRRPFKYNDKNLEFLLSARFSHTSAMLDESDIGVNTWGINVGVRW